MDGPQWHTVKHCLLKFIYSEKVTYMGQIIGGDFAKYFGLLRIYELYETWGNISWKRWWMKMRRKKNTERASPFFFFGWDCTWQKKIMEIMNEDIDMQSIPL